MENEIKNSWFWHRLGKSGATKQPVLIASPSGIEDFVSGSASTGAKSPATTANDVGNGLVAWTNPNNSQASDEVYATALITSVNSPTERLKATNFGFTIPTTATIIGIIAEIKVRTDNNNATQTNVVELYKNNILSSNLNPAGVVIPTVAAYLSFGSSTNLWGIGWTPENINNNGFGLAFSIGKTVSQDSNVSIDHIRITVYYKIVIGHYNFSGRLGHIYRTDFTVGGTVGSVSVRYGTGFAQTFNAGAGATSFQQFHTSGAGMLKITASSDFDGTVTAISIYLVA